MEKAIMYYSKAAQNAIANGAYKEAIQYLEEALKIDKNELGIREEILNIRYIKYIS
jgi:hypothetical protein